jgi:hypothetical protein
LDQGSSCEAKVTDPIAKRRVPYLASAGKMISDSQKTIESYLCGLQSNADKYIAWSHIF